MKATIQMGAVFALVSFGQFVHAWNATIYDSANCTGNRYHIYPEAEYTKYFEMDGSEGAEIHCAFQGINKSTGTCDEQFPVGLSVFSAVGSCISFSGEHSSGVHQANQTEGECKTTDFSIRSVVCYDE
ncbi:hypothetical protein F4678DRAFT_448105 [Xylaria arbuscula]|nr:hypothetical protein F4678DRAFT_448105 [Xylaria arbuscula]